ncbi:MAG: methyltransferase domain-containing protein [Blastocatellia bacterium]
MKISILNLLACPSCRGALELGETREMTMADDIESGTLICTVCARGYDITEGVPRLLLKFKQHRREQECFTFQWRLRFSQSSEPDQMLWGKDHSKLSYKVQNKDGWYLDCGCGSGEIIREIALKNPHLQAVGMDLSDAIGMVSRRDKTISNLHYVQGDILAPPFASDSFQFILSLGVLHHTSSPRQALHNTIDLLERIGLLSVWLYPDLEDLKAMARQEEYRKWRRYYFLRDKLFLSCSYRFNLRLLLWLCKLLSLLISPFGHLLDHAVPDFKLRYLSNTFILFDNLAPTYQFRHRKKEVIKWFRECGINKVLHSFDRGGLYTAMKS